ncbi:hypothetical protein PPERSA_06963 [Pseudocohnilembus persalinus]|uniref:Uncharacterized protein n=1 Tax=Pseudocohnilembus persalinus TaxID=266149 RepID=A0A0V0QYP4_PSEPJ|nr:hypothetical protein PPERSA_06963 [Pseudocohnilembus persalinus]|eukprot:KRX07348.1 hypothetical protein PPERSA_06963 [Pseudocohnilembus persalinus]
MSQDIKRSPKSDNLTNQENQKLIQDNKDLKRRLEERDKHIKYLNSQISQLQKLFTRYEHKIYQMLKEQIDQQDPNQKNSISGKTKREIINLEYLRIQDELQMKNQGEGQLNLKPKINGNNPTLYMNKIQKMHQQQQEMRQKKYENFSRKNKNLQSNISEYNIDNQNQIDYKQNDEGGVENSSYHLFSLGQENNNAFISKVPVNKLVRLDTREIDNRKHVVTEKILSSNQFDE